MVDVKQQSRHLSCVEQTFSFSDSTLINTDIETHNIRISLTTMLFII